MCEAPAFPQSMDISFVNRDQFQLSIDLDGIENMPHVRGDGDVTLMVGSQFSYHSDVFDVICVDSWIGQSEKSQQMHLNIQYTVALTDQ